MLDEAEAWIITGRCASEMKTAAAAAAEKIAPILDRHRKRNSVHMLHSRCLDPASGYDALEASVSFVRSSIFARFGRAGALLVGDLVSLRGCLTDAHLAGFKENWSA